MNFIINILCRENTYKVSGIKKSDDTCDSHKQG